MTQKEALDILKTGVNVFLTGEPGAGKTYTLNEYIKYLRNNGVEVAITASTGIAATHIGGMTIHSWSGIGIKNKLDKYDLDKISSSEYISKRINRAKVLVIDEVSMLSSQTLSMVEAVCREVKQTDEVFGGLQIIFVGDFFQLPPVVKRFEEQDRQATLIPDERESIFAYDCLAWENTKPIICYITEQYRQDDREFLSILSAIRQNTFNKDHLNQIEKRKIDRSNLPENIPKLFSHNINVDSVNIDTLSKIEREVQVFPMSSEGPDGLVAILQKGCLSPESLSLKIGAEVMFTKNNPKERFVNGTLGTVVDFHKISKYPIIKTRNGYIITVEPMEWSVEENGKIRAKITQIPLRLAWAITVHKSQGMSMDGAIMDLSEVFEYGQGYVALSRVRRLSGLYIIGLNKKAFQVHPEVLSRDKIFREQSLEAEKVFSEIPSDKLKKMHDNFIVASLGKVVSKSKKKENKIKVPFEEIRKKFPNAYKPWTKSEDEKLRKFFAKKIPVKEIVKEFGRKRGSITSRLEKLGLMK
ncbi:MAG: AAA ATPase [Candidatus Nomurabacteria bacterium GW2011_GWE1_32_28]|uniref:AAA ATPase n=1 Tax=Candidatus Nomurabacteria bacterium GW2011_GWF1_31_48 TaxID=1618767 RepID=A0A0G0BHJ0_9BACT|nr:MAG: AAA ATPase [Candidatus Nomurabacteria bacterium GW2011_GWF2_30_133]KKP29073.1 MAG: AAA ATPase [Candidatus Nomurabacteria bacterium GW2011_GWE2_31_40]KKP30517.1 MAG: AAA ATPase [Candidatus Nomurabacteria bacterium GW2011_GWF1_31_48]KKP35002.1 MAG: AAA ATPase [Candidatus Nomurabacteria bacterium GW2011_GWE1_32_28]HAS80630.1 AAA family ATPase [Candidatus Nomurabacteria bacterium]